MVPSAQCVYHKHGMRDEVFCRRGWSGKKSLWHKRESQEREAKDVTGVPDLAATMMHIASVGEISGVLHATEDYFQRMACKQW